MMTAWILNLPWTLLALFAVVASLPKRVLFHSADSVFIFHVRNFWWYSWLPNRRRVRGMTIGNVIMLGSNVLDKDLEHELVHVKQFQKIPFLFPFFYLFELLMKGYRNNRYEQEAYEKAGNTYID